MLEVPFRARRTRLHVKFPPYVQKNIADTPNAAHFAHVECCESELGREKVEEFWQQAVESRSEGLMIKARISYQEPSHYPLLILGLYTSS